MIRRLRHFGSICNKKGGSLMKEPPGDSLFGNFYSSIPKCFHKNAH